MHTTYIMYIQICILEYILLAAEIVTKQQCFWHIGMCQWLWRVWGTILFDVVCIQWLKSQIFLDFQMTSKIAALHQYFLVYAVNRISELHI